MNRTAAIAATVVLACAAACERSPGARTARPGPAGAAGASGAGSPEPSRRAETAANPPLVERIDPGPAVPTPEPLAAVAPAAVVSPARSFAEFRPSRDGFAFVNSFEGSPLPFELPGLEKNFNIPNRFGLCGGMSFAAADHFLAARAIPADVRQPPARGTPLYDYLYARQTASLGMYGAMSLKFLEWMRLPDGGPDGTRARTAAGLAAIREKLAAGRPVVLGLVFQGAKGGALWENHQVLAFAWEGPTAPEAGAPVSIHIYDPNFPGRDDVVIRCEPAPEGVRCARAGGGRRESGVRGVFEMPYAAATPPSDR